MIESRVSIVIPVYRGADYLQDRINAALAQTYGNVEVIVVSCGTDESDEIERIKASYGSRIRHGRCQRDGIGHALNEGIALMTGDYLAWMSHYELYAPDKIERQVQALQEAKEPAVAFCDVCRIDSRGKMLSHRRLPSGGSDAIRSVLSYGGEFETYGCALLIPRPILKELGRFNTEYRYAAEYEMWTRLTDHVSFVHLTAPLVLTRRPVDEDGLWNTEAYAHEMNVLLSRNLRQIPADVAAHYNGRSVEALINASGGIFDDMRYESAAQRALKHICLLADETGDWSRAASLLERMLASGAEGLTARTLWDEELHSAVKARKTKPRILVYMYNWVRGGGQRVLTVLLEGLKDEYEWYLVTSAPEADGFPLDNSINRFKLPYDERIASRLATTCALLDIDLYITSTHYLEPTLDVFDKLRKLEVKSIAADFGQYFLYYNIEGLHPVIERRLRAFGQASAVTWLTRYSSNIYAALHGNSVLLPTPNTFPAAKQIAPKTRKVVLAVGRWNDPIKRLDRILEVFSRVLANHPDAILKLVGPYDLGLRYAEGAPETYREILNRLAIPESSIRFEGEQSRVERYYMEAALLILVSESEGIPMVLNEACTFGLPCVINEITGLEDIIADGENGYIVAQDDYDAMASKVSRLLKDSELRMRMGDCARERVLQFSQESILERWNNLIQEVLASGTQQELNRVLAAKFMEPVHDIADFTRKVSREYERNLERLIHSKMVSAYAPTEQIAPLEAESQIAVAVVRDNVDVEAARVETGPVIDAATEVEIEPMNTHGTKLVVEAEPGPEELRSAGPTEPPSTVGDGGRSREAAIAHIEAYSQAMQELTSSFSWRITRPLRWCKKSFLSVRDAFNRLNASHRTAGLHPESAGGDTQPEDEAEYVRRLIMACEESAVRAAKSAGGMTDGEQ